VKPLDGLGAAYRGKRVFITGHTGFKGSWLAIWLHELGARVTGYALDPPTRPSNFVVSGVEGLLDRHVVADIRDRAALAAAVERSDPKVIFHLAAQPLVRDSYAAPLETFEINVTGTLALLEVVRARHRPCVVIVVTSDKCYENTGQVWGYRECDPLGGHDPYSASKGAAEVMVASWRRSFFDPARLGEHGVKLATVRAGNVIGGGDWSKDRIIPDAVSALLVGKPVPVRNPRAIRPWQHVLEPLGGYLTLAARMLASDDPTLCDAWNFGPVPGDEVPVADLVDIFVNVWGEGTWEHVAQASAPKEAAILRLAIDKAVARLGWRPRWRVVEAVERTATWYRQHAKQGGDMAEQCRADIRAYLGAA
jgi:CDP-glucose 4,6-dehydratase